MFKDAEHKFKGGEHKFKGGEHKFTVREHKILECIQTFQPSTYNIYNKV